MEAHIFLSFNYFIFYLRVVENYKSRGYITLYISRGFLLLWEPCSSECLLKLTPTDYTKKKCKKKRKKKFQGIPKFLEMFPYSCINIKLNNPLACSVIPSVTLPLNFALHLFYKQLLPAVSPRKVAYIFKIFRIQGCLAVA